MHKQALLDHLSNYHTQLMSIDRRVKAATSGRSNTMVLSLPIRHRTKPNSNRMKPKPNKAISKPDKTIRKPNTTKGPQENRIHKQQEKLPMEKFREITSALCDVHMILTHLVGIETTQSVSLRRQAESLEDIAVHTVIGLADVALLVYKRKRIIKEFGEFKDLLTKVSKMLLRGGPGSELQEQKKRRRKMLKSGCEGLAQTLQMISIEKKTAEDESVMDLT